MAKTKEYFYAGIVLASNRVSNLHFSGVWEANKNDKLPDVIDDIMLFESNAHGGADVTLTAFNKL